MQNEVFERIRQEITGHPVVLFMKGTPAFPQCGFSAAMVQMLEEAEAAFKGVDLLADSELLRGIKEFSNWPATPQLYIKGEFIGGCDVVREMHQGGELRALLREKGL